MIQKLLTWWHGFDALPVPPPVRFLLVGTTGVGVNMAVLWVLLGHLGLPSLLAAALAVEISICSNFLLNDAWTFGAARGVRHWRTRISAFHGAAAVAAGANLGLFALLTSVAGLHYLAADLIAIAVASVINFSISASWIWRARPPLASTAISDASRDWRPAKRVVVIPTYDEGANIRRLLERILSLGEEYEALVVDDSSPDGTGEIVAAMAAREPRVHLMSRGAKMGIASAYISGFRMALNLGADLIYQMDSDFSHDPSRPSPARRSGDAERRGDRVTIRDWRVDAWVAGAPHPVEPDSQPRGAHAARHSGPRCDRRLQVLEQGRARRAAAGLSPFQRVRISGGDELPCLEVGVPANRGADHFRGPQGRAVESVAQRGHRDGGRHLPAVLESDLAGWA